MNDSNFETVTAVQRLILKNIDDENFCAEDVYRCVGYSPRHINRIFKFLTGKTVSEYIKALRLSKSSVEIEHGKRILDAALDAGFETNEGYSKAFAKLFGVLPSEHKNGVMIPRFIPYPVYHSVKQIREQGGAKLKESILVTVFTVDKPKRKMIILRSRNATDYFSFCEECGCEWEGYLNSNPKKLDTAAIVTLPDRFVKAGTSKIAAGIEVPFDYTDSALADGYEIIELPECIMVYFKSQPFENEDDFCLYIDAVNNALETFDFSGISLEKDLTKGPFMNFGAQTETGARIACPAKDHR